MPQSEPAPWTACSRWSSCASPSGRRSPRRMVRGRGDEKLADQAAVDAMRAELNRLDVRGRVVIGEGERDEAPMLYIGEEVGTGDGPEVDIALDPLEGTTICAKNLPNSLSVIAITRRGGLLNAPDVYMEKIAIGPGYPDGLVDLDMPPDEAIRRLAEAKGVQAARHLRLHPRPAAPRPADRGGALDRRVDPPDRRRRRRRHHPHDRPGDDRHRHLSRHRRRAGGRARRGGAPLHRRPDVRPADRSTRDEKRARAERMGIAEPGRVYRAEEMASGDVLFAATGVTDGNLLDGVRFHRGIATTHTIVTRSHTGTQRWVQDPAQDRRKIRLFRLRRATASALRRRRGACKGEPPSDRPQRPKGPCGGMVDAADSKSVACKGVLVRSPARGTKD